MAPLQMHAFQMQMQMIQNGNVGTNIIDPN